MPLNKELFSFICNFNEIESLLICTQNEVSIQCPQNTVVFPIHLKLKIFWNVENNIIVSCSIGNNQITANQCSLFLLKKTLGGRVTYLNISQLYQEHSVLKTSQTKKICILNSRIEQTNVICKVYKKDLIQDIEIKNEIYILNKLKGQKGFVQLIECYESELLYYVILEKLYSNLENDYTHEYNQEIIKNIVELLQHLQNLNIVHNKIRPENFMFDEKNQIVLIGFFSARFFNTKENLVDLKSIGKIILFLFNIPCQQDDTILPIIPNHGTNFLKGILNSTQYGLNITQALNHPFLNFKGKQKEIQFQVIKPKFILQQN